MSADTPKPPPEPTPPRDESTRASAAAELPPEEPAPDTPPRETPPSERPSESDSSGGQGVDTAGTTTDGAAESPVGTAAELPPEEPLPDAARPETPLPERPSESETLAAEETATAAEAAAVGSDVERPKSEQPADDPMAEDAAATAGETGAEEVTAEQVDSEERLASVNGSDATGSDGDGSVEEDTTSPDSGDESPAGETVTSEEGTAGTPESSSDVPPSEETPPDEQPVDEQSTDEQLVDEQRVDEALSLEEQPVDEQKPTDATPADETQDGSSDGAGPQTPMEKWEANEDRIIAENIVAVRDHQEVLRQQGNEEAALDEEAFIQKLPVSDEIKANPQAYLDSLQKPETGPDLAGESPQTPMEKWEANEDRIMAESIVGLRQQEEIFRQQGNEVAAQETEEFIQKLPVSDEIKADPKAYLHSTDSTDSTGASDRDLPGADNAEAEVHRTWIDTSGVQGIEPVHRAQESTWQWGDDPSADRSGPAPEVTRQVTAGDRVPTGDNRVEGVWNASQPIPNGRSFVPSWDVAAAGAAEVVGKPGEYTAVIHGNPQLVGMQDAAKNDVVLSPSQMADLIRSDPNWNGEPVRLVSCNTGALPGNGDDCFAQHLADELGTDVWAPSKYVFGGPGNGWSSSLETRTCPVTGKKVVQAKTTPRRPDGWFYRFRPADRRS